VKRALPPHLPLTDYYADESARHRWLRHAFDQTASDYDRIERITAFGTGPHYRRRALARAGLAPGMDVIDVGMGTGLTAIAAVSLTGDARRVTGVDPSAGMLANAKVPVGLTVLAGRAEALPLADGSADFVSMGFALRHVSDVNVVFAEFRRVLRPGGRVCLLEIARPQSRAGTWALKLYMRRIVPAIARVFGGTAGATDLWRYFWDSIEACLPPAQVLAALREAGFADVRRDVELGIFNAYVGRRSD
jgi:demethylmenaquinone methyltransferase/2-methoxy-6-polyprenyl-1,4-benzoquinol methylase